MRTCSLGRMLQHLASELGDLVPLCIASRSFQLFNVPYGLFAFARLSSVSICRCSMTSQEHKRTAMFSFVHRQMNGYRKYENRNVQTIVAL
jgi:phosphatidylglycerophosphate synthase